MVSDFAAVAEFADAVCESAAACVLSAFVSDVFAAFAEFPAAVAEEAALPALEAALVSDDLPPL